MKKYILISIIFIILIISLLLYFQVQASNQLDGIEQFPKSYQPYLYQIAKKHPNWKFTALYTNLDWNTVIKEENIFGKNLVPINYSDSWKNTKPGEYNVEIDKGWVDCSKQALEYCIDPRNFLNEVRLFQFEGLSYNSKTNNLNGIEKILYGTEFYNQKVSYLTSTGTQINTNYTYGDLILKGGITSYVSPYHLASRIKQEVGPFLSHSSISGTVEGFKGLYNFYNIGATSSPEPMGAIKNGLQYAKDGKGASIETKNKYLIPWNTKEIAITGGAIFIGSSYINIGQNTIYLQKFDVNDNKKGELFWHQYMTNVLAPYSESKSIYNGYQKSNLLNTSMHFIIPIYNNMPQIPTDNPNIKTQDFTKDNTKIYCNANNVNIRTGPSTSYEIITTVSTTDIMTRINKGIQTGERWDKVLLQNGIVGYIYQTYVEELKHVDVDFEKPLVVNDLQITGIDYPNHQVINIKKQIKTNYEIQFINCNNEILSDTDEVGTGTRILLKQNETIVGQYTIILYGDANGDGKINSVDLLVIQRHILGIQKISEIFEQASNVRKNSKSPSSVDLLLIQRHILNLQIITQ